MTPLAVTHAERGRTPFRAIERIHARAIGETHADTQPGHRIRVLQIIHALYFGGAENVLVKLALGVDPSRFEMAVCCTQNVGPLAGPLNERGIDVMLAGPRGRVQNLLRPWHVRRVIAAFRPHVVHTHGLPALAEVGPLAILGQAPRWIHTYHYGNYPYAGKRHHMPVERFFSGVADQLVAVSDRQRADIVHYHRLDPQRIVTIPNGVASNPYVGDGETRGRVRAELGFSPDAVVVGTVAVLTEQKGLSYFLQAVEMVHRAVPNARFLIVGGGPLEAALREEAAARGLAAAVVFTGWRPDVPQLLCAFDVFVMASLWEAMPVALLEAMAARLPIVVTDVGQNHEIVQDGAVVVAPRAPSPIAEAVLALLAEPKEAARLAETGHSRVHAQFTTARMVSRYEALYSAGHSLASSDQGRRRRRW